MGQLTAVGPQECPGLYLCLGIKKKKTLNAAHENEISTQEDEGCLFDDRNLGNMACILQGTSLTFFFLKKKISVIKNITQLSVLKQCVLMRAPQVV